MNFENINWWKLCIDVIIIIGLMSLSFGVGYTTAAKDLEDACDKQLRDKCSWGNNLDSSNGFIVDDDILNSSIVDKKKK